MNSAAISQMKQTTTVSKALSWSTLSHQPVIAYVEEADDYAVAWCGILTSLKHAMVISASHWYQMPITPAVKNAAFESLNNLVSVGAFGNVKWNENSPQTYYSNVKVLLMNREALSKPPANPLEYFKLFDTDNAIMPTRNET